jgi:hypothetical protein
MNLYIFGGKHEQDYNAVCCSTDVGFIVNLPGTTGTGTGPGSKSS